MSTTLTPGVSHGNVVGGIVYTSPVTVAAGSIVPKGLWLAVGTAVDGGGTAVFQAQPPGAGAAAPAMFIVSDGITVTSNVAATLYRYIFG
jgi:hypothetical protein